MILTNQNHSTVKIFIPLLLAMLFSSAAFACGCKESISNASNIDDVFTGTVTDIKTVLVDDELPRKFESEVTFNIVNRWKGAPVSHFTLVTGWRGSDCGYDFKLGQTYLVHAYHLMGVNRATVQFYPPQPVADATDDILRLNNKYQ